MEKKMFKKDGKKSEKDVGFAEDSFEGLKQSCGYEAHAHAHVVINQSIENIKEYNQARGERTLLMKVVIKHMDAELTNQRWCQLKHCCTAAMHIQELSARLVSLKELDLESISFLAILHRNYFLIYLKLLGVTEENMGSPSTA